MSDACGSWEEGEIYLQDRDKSVPCWRFSTPTSPNKWKVIAYPDGACVVSLGLVGPRWEVHGQRYWVRVWKARDIDDAKRFVERQEAPPPPVTGPQPEGDVL